MVVIRLHSDRSSQKDLTFRVFYQNHEIDENKARLEKNSFLNRQQGDRQLVGLLYPLYHLVPTVDGLSLSDVKA